MKLHSIVWRPQARDQLLALYDWIADRADPDTAYAYTSAIEAHVATLAAFPERGMPRDDLHPGLRTIPYRRRTVIAYRITAQQVEIIALAHGGQMLDVLSTDE